MLSRVKTGEDSQNGGQFEHADYTRCDLQVSEQHGVLREV